MSASKLLARYICRVTKKDKEDCEKLAKKIAQDLTVRSIQEGSKISRAKKRTDYE